MMPARATCALLYCAALIGCDATSSDRHVDPLTGSASAGSAFDAGAGPDGTTAAGGNGGMGGSTEHGEGGAPTGVSACVEGTSETRGSEFTEIIVYDAPEPHHSACWHVIADSDVRICEGSYPFGDGTEVISTGLHCPPEWTFKCTCRHDPIIGTLVGGIIETWFYVVAEPPAALCDGCTVVTR